MKKYIFVLIFGFALYSCEKEQDTEPPVYYDSFPGTIKVEFVNDARLKSAFDLVNNFHLQIAAVKGLLYTSKLPADSLDYVIDMLRTKPYLYNDISHIHPNGDVYVDINAGKITVVYIMKIMDESCQADWAITTALLKLEEQPSLKSFKITVPDGEEIYWRDKFRMEYIVSQADLISVIGYN